MLRGPTNAQRASCGRKGFNFSLMCAACDAWRASKAARTRAASAVIRRRPCRALNWRRSGRQEVCGGGEVFLVLLPRPSTASARVDARREGKETAKATR